MVEPMRSAFLVACALLAACAPSSKADAEKPPPPSRYVRIIDGDTLAYRGETIRLANIDAPELPPHSKCWGEAGLAIQAAQRIQELVDMSPGFVVIREGKDRYGRTLARIELTTTGDLGESLVHIGVAAPWTGKRQDWCGPADLEHGVGVGLDQGPDGNANYLDWNVRRQQPLK